MRGGMRSRRIIWHLFWTKVRPSFRSRYAFLTLVWLDKSLLRSSLSDNSTNTRLALQHYTRSAAQRNVDALVKVADYHFHGLGTPKDVNRAVGYYSAAVDTQLSALAMWNLGWCYENGVGVPKVIILSLFLT